MLHKICLPRRRPVGAASLRYLLALRWVPAVALVALALGGCEDPPCENAFDCDVGEVCTEGECTPAPTPTPEPETGEPEAPETTLVVPEGPTRDPSVTLTLSCDAEACSFECRVGNAAYAFCESGTTLDLPGEGEHRIFARAIANDTGLVDESPAEAGVIVDQTPPVVAFENVPDAESNQRSGSIVFGCGEEDCTGKCTLDDAEPTDCDGSLTFSGLADGPHALEIVPTDLAGNVGEAARYEWIIDATPPGLTLLEVPPALSRSDVATVAFECDETCRVLCSLDGATAVECSSPYLVTAGEGTHVLTLAATDFFGNAADVATVEWAVDATAPETTIDIAPTDGTDAYRVQVGFRCDEAPCTFECRLDGGEFASCSSPVEYVALEPGARAVTVRAIDEAGNVDATPAVTTWTHTRTWTDIAASHHYCAIAGNGSLWCWGDNSRGQVGIGAASDDEILAPVNVGGDDWVDVANGAFHTCAVKVDGSLWCWGANNFGQLGLGEGEPDFAYPRRVGDANDWVSVWRDGASALHSCAVSLTDVLCWGRNVDGEVGIGSVADSVSVPSVVTLEAPESRVSLALGRSTSVPRYHYWGRSTLGKPEAGDSRTPRTPGGDPLQDQSHVLKAMEAACFVESATMGRHAVGILGPGASAFSPFSLCSYGGGGVTSYYDHTGSTPCTDDDLRELFCGPDFYCALGLSGDYEWCFANGAIGLGGTEPSSILEEAGIQGPDTYVAMAGGFQRTLFLTDDGRMLIVDASTPLLDPKPGF